MKPIKPKKHYDFVVVDDYICIDASIVIHKDYITIADEALDIQLKNSTLARYRTDVKYLEYLEHKPTGWDNVIPTQPYNDDLPMLMTDISIEICKEKYQILKCDSLEFLELQGINAQWLKDYLPMKTIYYSPSKNQFTIWENNKLIALIMPCSFKRSFLNQMVDEINNNRKTLQQKGA